jgi:dTDP-3-amino-3,4,6-trideoxy-alpha-D-glucose transaminase
VSVPLFVTSLDAYQGQIAERLTAVAASGRYILGPEVKAFEKELADYLGVDYAIGVGNGTDALTIALRALGVKPGTEVIVPSFTFYASVEAILNAGALPVFADVDPDTMNVTLATVQDKLTDDTAAILPVHLFGNPAPVDELLGLGVPVLEDAAQAIGARRDHRRIGTLAHAATFSFFPSKNLGGLGDGGAIVTRNADVAERARRLRFHGSEDKVTYTEVGYNSRLDELQAAVLRVLLPELDGWNESRRAAARAYEEAGIRQYAQPQAVDARDEPVYHLYVVRADDADALQQRLEAAGIGARGYYRTPVHLQPAMAGLGGDRIELPGTMEVARTHLALPMGTQLEREQVEAVVAACASGST